jgi:hypothetical protein
MQRMNGGFRNFPGEDLAFSISRVVKCSLIDQLGRGGEYVRAGRIRADVPKRDRSSSHSAFEATTFTRMPRSMFETIFDEVEGGQTRLSRTNGFIVTGRRRKSGLSRIAAARAG